MLSIKQVLLNLPGWHTRRKFVIIHSDDWGSIRVPSNTVREKLFNHPLIDVSDAYAHYDTLETKNDLEALFEALRSVKDQHGRPAVVTANCLMANPDFERIRDSKFQTYHYETIDKTFNRYQIEESLRLWKQGCQDGIFVPQFHGREHVNIPFWMEQLRHNHEGVKLAFDYGVFGVRFRNLSFGRNNFQAAWDFNNSVQEASILESIKDGVRLFRDFFGYVSRTAISPAYVWSHRQETTLRNLGVCSMQGIPYQYIPSQTEKFDRVLRYTNVAKNQMGYQMRNVFFEPSLQSHTDTVGKAIKRIELAFLMKKPAIVGSHRLNFIGALNEANRRSNLLLFKELLHRIVKKWPDVEFISSNELHA